VSGPVAQDVVPRDIRLVADRDEFRQTESESRGLIHHRESDGPALREEPDAPFNGDRRRERAVQPDLGIRVHDAHTVRADQSHPRGPAHLEELALATWPFSSDLYEPGGDHDEGTHPLLGALT